MTTTAFCTVDLVISADLRLSLSALSCLVQDIPKSEVAGWLLPALFLKVKYEKSSVDLHCQSAQWHQIICIGSHAWAPSDRAINGNKDQSLSAAGSAPSSVPTQNSISGPLQGVSILSLQDDPELALHD